MLEFMRLIMLALTVLLGLVACAPVKEATSAPSPTPASPVYNVLLFEGKEGLAAVDKESLDALVEAAIAKDYVGMAKLETQGKIFWVKNGIKVLIIDRALGARQVRFMEEPLFSRTGWVPMEWVK